MPIVALMGDAVKAGDLLYSVDDDLQQADLNQNKRRWPMPSRAMTAPPP
jgi:multidrug efflux pump subunit AcrA (membrane-fusion protein)